MCAGGGGGGNGGDISLDDEDRDLGQSMRPGTFEAANSTIGRFVGENRSDQEIKNDQAVTDALERGDKNFVDAGGRTRSVAGYSRDSYMSDPDSLLGRINDPRVGLGDVLGMGVRAAVGGLPGMVAGQVAGRTFTSMFPSTSVRMSTLGGGRGKGGTGQ